ncbi:MAG: hypothetical protein IPH84_03220, partial [Bacteroidales bacterium]|nr:hypothetical protein [Bacteroidales bacterium]
GEIVSFTGLSQLFPVGTSYLFITADFVATATIGNNISCESTTNSDLTFTSNPTFSGSSFTAANLHSIIVGPTILQPGDISFIGYGNDTPDKFAFIVLKNLNDNTSITFTDNAWTGTALATNENTGTYTVPSGGLLIGSIVHIEGTTVIGGGTMSAGLSGLAIDGDQILAYQGSSATPNFLAGVSSTGWLTSGSTNSNSSYLPSALALYVSAIGFSSEEDNGYYSGPMTLANGAVAAFICNPANWTRSSTVQTFPAWSFTLGNHTLVDVTSAVQNLNILNIESLTIDASKQLTVAGNLVLESDATGTGSLIDNGTLVSTNNTVERFITKYDDAGDDMYHFLSSPVALQNISTEFSDPRLITARSTSSN